MALSINKVFNPLEGTELARLIAFDVEQALLRQQDFRGHLTYPCVKWEFEVRLKVHPSEPAEFKSSAAGEVQVDPAALAVTVVTGARNLDGREAESQAVDDARREAGLPVPKAVQTRLGRVDAFEIALEKKPPKGLVK